MAERAPPKCAVQGCESGDHTFHTLPKEPNCRQAWLMFIFSKIPHTFNPKLLICSAHFTSDCFANMKQFQAGFAQRLVLNRGTVPTLLPPYPLWPPKPQLESQTSTVGLHQLPHTSDACCQTDVVSQETQLSSKTLRPQLRSIGTQATVPYQSVAVGSTTTAMATLIPLSSTPVKTSWPVKRPHLELELEEEVENGSTAATEPQDSTHDTALSITNETESSRPFTPPFISYGDAKYIVFEDCLLSLFETCPVCTKACNVHPRRRGTFLAVDQLCPHCGFFRQWRSQPKSIEGPNGET
ncbi:hypothetical protein AALO_G00012750 [Alosa alosa]|uniref:THAP domain-containing protein 1 n=1 Tax=Alosa alosa TaxID=278164 RepID=A0AAV6HK32_9TELE|nr:hypothetical protein AALO_G00012750 [Alosa alosa]